MKRRPVVAAQEIDTNFHDKNLVLPVRVNLARERYPDVLSPDVDGRGCNSSPLHVIDFTGLNFHPWAKLSANKSNT